MSELRRSVAVAGVVVALTAAISAVLQHQERLQHLAVPTLQRRAEAAPTPRVQLAQAKVSAEVVAELGGRISAIEQDARGTVWVGLFDRGLARVRPGVAHPEFVKTRPGRERFVSDVLVADDRIYAATFAGVLEVSAEGERVRLHLEGVGVEALGRVGERIFAGTSKGLYALRRPSGDFVPVETGTERPRVTAMTAVGEELWLATPRGVYVVAVGEESTRMRWIPLVFGSPGASTNVAMAIAPDGQGGAIVGTDNGGLVRISREHGVAAVAFQAPRANEINPGAAAVLGDQVVFGTQGGGLLLASTKDASVAQAMNGAAVSAVSVEAGAVLVGTAEGKLVRVRGGEDPVPTNTGPSATAARM